MNNTVVIAAVCTLFTSVSVSAKPIEAFDNRLENYPKNMSRHHIGTNLFAFDTAKMAYEPTEAAAAWLDDDVSTGWPPMEGRNYYLLALPEADLLTNFMISAKGSIGKINLYAGDELALPDSGSWSPFAMDLDISEINGRKMRKPFGRFAKYLLIEVNLKEQGQWYSLYTGARVLEVDTATDPVSCQKAIDDNPESSISITSSENTPGMVLEYASPVSIRRVSLLTNGNAKGRFDFYLLATLDSKQPVAWN